MRETTPPSTDFVNNYFRTSMSGQSSPTRLFVPLALAFFAADASANGVVVIGQFLALLALVGGALGGALAAWQGPKASGFGVAFMVYLGLVSLAGSTWVQSMEMVPLALVYAAAAGVIPFGAGFFGLRYLGRLARARWGGKTDNKE
jgi:hypothetical protein